MTSRARLSMRIPCRSDAAFACGVSLIWLMFYNSAFWTQTLHAMWTRSLGSLAFFASLVLLIATLQALVLLMMPTRWLMRLAASALFVIASVSSYFTSAYGALMNEEMLRNVIETDRAEVFGLLNADLLWRLLLFGVLPAILVWKVGLPPMSWPAQLRRRALFAILAVGASAGGVLACSADYAVFLRTHKPIRYTLSPGAPLSSAADLAIRTRTQHGPPREDPGGLAERVSAPGARPLLLFLVVGETARAANFQLGGYARATTPELAAMKDVVYFDKVTACGTSTAVSVPCLFSPLGRGRFEPHEAARYTNLLDSLADASFDIEWRDNNAGCKGVCARVRTIAYSERANAHRCAFSYCHDEVLLEDLEMRLRNVTHDTVIVFHQIGSHGPAYRERYPEAFERFRPACGSNELHRCSHEAILNAYDNTIAYTDHVLARQIQILRDVSGRMDSALLYVSDHGESLGEQGVYLHGLPYAFAPRAQKEVPLLIWMSDGYVQRSSLNRECVRRRARQPASHDFIYHTVLGLAETRDRLYDARLDLLAACRAGLS